MPVTSRESWTVVDDNFIVIDPAERYLAHLAGIERSPNTVRAYAHSLALWLEFLASRGWAGPTPGWRTSPGSSPGCALRPRTSSSWTLARPDVPSRR
ncbi:site-specific integrase [Ornithinimicrobium sp. CNJ-824]|uniref:site-specific integrase n=1 Tax=Ornithinimicrobium sp. CNJ-824 TaxID=1904966 RepID=UPI00406D0F9C